MKRILYLIPFSCFLSILTFLVGWTWFDWHITTVLPYLIAFSVLFLSSLAWQSSSTKWVKQLSVFLFLIALVSSATVVLELTTIKSIGALFILIGLSSIQLYLYELAKQSMLFRGYFKTILLVPLLLTILSIIGLYSWNGSLIIAWLSLGVATILSLVGLIAGYKRT